MEALFGGPVAANDNSKACKRCGSLISDKPGPGRKAKFCSDDCRYAPSITVGECASCGQVTVGRRSRRFCGVKCRNDYNCARYRSVAANDNEALPLVACGECPTLFRRPYGSHRTVFCSHACFKKNKNRRGRERRRALARGVSSERVDPIKVFERDKWSCQICGVKTPRKLRGSYDDKAPELDHVMPISLGGAHSYMNTQCACRKCNADKSNTPPAQPSLFAMVA